MAKTRIVVVGAGVSGLTTALLLASNEEYDITIVGRYFPGDRDATYCSPWAGAVIIPVAQSGTKEARWEGISWAKFTKMATSAPDAGLEYRDTILYQRDDEEAKNAVTSHATMLSRDPWLKYDSVEAVAQGQLPKSVEKGFRLKSLCLNPDIYLPYILSKCLDKGVAMKRLTLKSLADAANAHSSGQRADVVVNCTGVMAALLPGLGRDGSGDKAVFPIRGQTMLVANASTATRVSSGSDDAVYETTYMLSRPGGGATVLGGCYGHNDWNPNPDEALAGRIAKRALEMFPQLDAGNGLDVITNGVGLRPERHGGPRVSSSWVEGVLVVHNYGHGGAGFKLSYGCATDAVEQVRQVLQDSSSVLEERANAGRQVKL